MTPDIILIEKEFYESLKQDSVYEQILMDELLVPFGYEKNLTRYFNNNDSIWFARSKIKDEESYYYFGLKEEDTLEDIYIKLVFKFNNDIKKTNLRFHKGDALISCKIKDNNPEIIDMLPKPYLKGKNGTYYVNLGKIGDKTALNKIEELIRLFDFEVSIDKNIQINSLIKDKQNTDSVITQTHVDLDVIRSNLEILKLKNYINENIDDEKLIKQLDNYLFYKDEEDNFQLNENLFFKSLKFENILDLLYKTISELETYSFEQFKVDYNVQLQIFYSSIQYPIDIDLILSIDNHVIPDEVVVDSVVGDVSDEVVVDSVVGDVSDEVVIDSEIIGIIPDVWKVDEVELDENQQEIFEEFILLKEDDWIQYEFENYNITENNLDVIFSKIKMDIHLGIIKEDDDFEDILIEYFEKFYLDCNYNNMSSYYEKIINSSFYEDLKRYYGFDAHDVDDIDNKVKLDIQSKNLDKQDLINRFKIYFESKYYELNYKSELNVINRKKYQDEFNLNESEINEVINCVIFLIENWYENLSIFNNSCKSIFTKCLNDKLDLIRSKTRMEFEKRYETKEVILEVLGIQSISDEQYNRIIEDIYWDINALIIRFEDINDNLLKEYF